MKKTVSILIFFIFTLLIHTETVFSDPIDKSDIPPDLAQWVPWVLYGQDEMFCPTLCNNPKDYQCIWPSRLDLDAEKEEGSFRQEWMVFAEAWVPLPGSPELWPEKVMVNGEPATVIRVDDTPSLLLKPGEYEVKGMFKWKYIPEIMQIPDKTGLISLSINNRVIPFPVLDEKGQLWIRKRVSPKTREDRIELMVFRKIIDDIPMRIINWIQLNISGQAREIRLNDVLLDMSVPMKITSQIPVGIGKNGEISAQVRPGKWDIKIETRFKDPVYEIGPVKCAYGRESWVFQSCNDLRIVEIQGVSPIDPSRTALPEEWKTLPAYLMDKDDTIVFKQIIRGNAEPAPDRIVIRRTWWLDFDGRGFTIQDNINGTMSRSRYLAMHPSGVLGRVSVNGEDQLITMHGGKQGIEIRHGNINLIAESRVNNSGRIHASGWDHDFESASGTLNLPPGWKLFALSGVDSAPGTWFRKWTLLDIFIILIISVGTAKLKNRIWGGAALITMILIWHEPESPQYVWLHILASFALLKLLPAGKMKSLIRIWGAGAVLGLLLITIPFMIHQIRKGIYPQLEYPWKTYQSPMSRSTGDRVMQDTLQYQEKAVTRREAPSKYDKLYYKSKAVFTHDPDAGIQTGPGLPGWNWRSVDIKWQGPVKKSQEIRFWLISPVMNLILSFVRVLLLALLICGLLDIINKWRNIPVAASAAPILFLIIICLTAQAHSAGFPTSDLLKELQQKLLESDDCYQPSCANYSRMDIFIDSSYLEIKLEVHAAKQTAVPLPGSLKSWHPQKILQNEQEVETIIKDKSGTLWILVPEGIHILTLKGITGSVNEINLPMELKPFSAFIKADGWEAAGIHGEGRSEGMLENAIQFNRLKKEEDIKEYAASDAPSSFLHVERTLSIGIKWETATKVERRSPLGTPVVVYIPLLPGESPTSPGIHVKDNQALVSMGPRQESLNWISTLEKTERLSLQMQDTDLWSETWIIDASPIWHLEFFGIPVVHNQDDEGLWKPTWRPWPGEKVDIEISKPKTAEGRTVTIDNAEMTWTPGNRISNARIQMKIRSSKGSRHQVELPEGSELKQLKIDGKTTPIRQEGNNAVITLKPGSQDIDIEWQQNKPISFFEKGQIVKIGEQAVNARVTFNMPGDRWILLLKGPGMGPAVLFWSHLVVILIASLILGKIKITPLKTMHWMLLGIGLTQIHSFGAVIAAGWFFALGMRKKTPPPEGWFKFDIMQLSLILWTIAAMFCFYLAVKKGLLGIPEMQIAGNGSSSAYLHWYQDRINGIMPRPWVLSLPRLTYHFLMLIWALWLAASMVKWLHWGWECFTHVKLWEKARPRISRKQ